MLHPGNQRGLREHGARFGMMSSARMRPEVVENWMLMNAFSQFATPDWRAYLMFYCPLPVYVDADRGAERVNLATVRTPLFLINRICFVP